MYSKPLRLGQSFEYFFNNSLFSHSFLHSFTHLVKFFFSVLQIPGIVLGTGSIARNKTDHASYLHRFLHSSWASCGSHVLCSSLWKVQTKYIHIISKFKWCDRQYCLKWDNIVPLYILLAETMGLFTWCHFENTYSRNNAIKCIQLIKLEDKNNNHKYHLWSQAYIR